MSLVGYASTSSDDDDGEGREDSQERIKRARTAANNDGVTQHATTHAPCESVNVTPDASAGPSCPPAQSPASAAASVHFVSPAVQAPAIAKKEKKEKKEKKASRSLEARPAEKDKLSLPRPLPLPSAIASLFTPKQGKLKSHCSA